MENKKLEVVIEKYTQKGEGVAFYNNIPIYIFGTIKNELVEIKITKVHEKFMIGELIKIIKPSKNRNNLSIDNCQYIGGYELIHMNDEEQINFKIERIKNDFYKIANINLKNIESFVGKKRFKYRNKITIHDGCFYKKNTNEKIEIDDFLLSNIKWDKNLQGEIIYRQLDELIYGKKGTQIFTFDSWDKYKFRVNLNSFYQINKEVMKEVYYEIKSNVIDQGVTVDLFAGIGTISIVVSDKSSKVISVENNRNSHNDAIYNGKINNVSNVVFIKEDVNNFIYKIKNEKIDTLILDPSRVGVGKKTMQLICEIKPRRIIYLSCNPGTQAADFNHIKNFYKIKKVKMFDMFPQTYHIENLLVCDLM